MAPVDANHDSLTALSRVIVDDMAAGRMATQRLGHRRIGYISDPLQTVMNFTSSRQGLFQSRVG